MSYSSLYLGSLSAGQIDFTASIIRHLRYQPVSSNDDILEETITVALQGSPSALEGWLETASQVCGRVRRHPGDQVRQPNYLTCQPSAGGETWRSPVESAVLEVLPAYALRKSEPVETPLERQRGVTWVQVRLERQNYWEAAQIIPLITSQVVENGCTDGQSPNHFGIDAGLLTGSSPAPLEFEITNSSSAALGSLWLGIDSRIESPRPYHLECEDMTSLGSGVSTTSRVDFSQGAGLSFSGSPGTETRIGIYSLEGVDLAYGYNRAYRALLLAMSTSDDLQGWVQLVHDGAVLVRGPVASLGDGVTDLGVLNLPPWPYDPASIYTPESVNLELWIYQESGTPSAVFDAFKLLPVDGGSMQLVDLGGGLPVGETLVYQDGRFITYLGDRAIEAEYYASHHLRGECLWVHPGEHARLHFAWERSSGGFDAGDSLAVSLYYRRRQPWI